MRLKALLVLLCITPGAYAHESEMSSAYSFGGACASQGVWTQSALSATQNLRKVTLQLKDDANCKALGVSLEAAIQNLESSLKSASDTPARVNRLSQIPREVNALRTFLASAPEMKQQILKVMMDRSIEGATLSAQVSRDQGDISVLSAGILDFGARLQQSTQTGISMLNQVVDSIPRIDQCLIGDQDRVLGSFIGTAVQLASSFASSGQDSTGSQLAVTVSKLSNLAVERKFAKVLRKLNQQEFMTSMACLMEVTSESYCQARIGMNLFKKGMDDLKIRRGNPLEMTSGNPFVGYYILNTHVPNITKWLQKIQIGVDPKLPTDAQFQNKIQQEVTDFYTGLKVLLGDYNSELLTIKSLADTEAKKNTALQLLFKITESMVSNGASFGPDKRNKNFFTSSRNPLRIPFDLVGINIPDQVLGKVMPKLTYDEWFSANIDDIPAFKDPVSLAETIGQNMRDIMRSANISAIEYFNKWYIVDKSALVNESTIDVNYTVPESLLAIYQYLEEEKERIKKYNGDPVNIPTIVDTQIRIQAILNGYKELEHLGKKTLNNPDAMKTEAEILAVAEVYEKLVNKVYEQFNVMQSRSGFLANRMVNFVYQDYILLLKNKVDFTPYEQDLFTATGMAAIDKMLQMYNGNPANIQTDLNMALRINKGNIEALEDLLKDSVIRTITELDLVKNGEDFRWGTTLKRAAIDHGTEDTKDSKWFKNFPSSFSFYKLLFLPINTAGQLVKHSSRYPVAPSGTTSPQSEFDDAEAVKAQLCIQALAFNDQTNLSSLCQGAVLKSPFGETNSNLDVSYDKKLTAYFDDSKLSLEKKKSWNHSDRICAFRDFNMQNMAKFMSMNKISTPAAPTK